MAMLGKSRFVQLSCHNDLERIGRNAGGSPLNASRFLVSLNTYRSETHFWQLHENLRNPRQIDSSSNQFRNTLQRDSASKPRVARNELPWVLGGRRLQP